MNYPEFVAALAKPLPTEYERLAHALYGLIGELGELVDAYKKHLIYGKPFDRGNAIEELGDFRFYLQMFLNEGVKPRNITYGTTKLEGLFGKLLFQCAKRVGEVSDAHLSGLNEKIFLDMPISRTIGVWFEMCYSLNVDPEEVIHLNMEKLSKRYPNISYSDEHAIARLDKNEKDNHV